MEVCKVKLLLGSDKSQHGQGKSHREAAASITGFVSSYLCHEAMELCALIQFVVELQCLLLAVPAFFRSAGSISVFTGESWTWFWGTQGDTQDGRIYIRSKLAIFSLLRNKMFVGTFNGILGRVPMLQVITITFCCIVKPKLDPQDIYSRPELLKYDLKSWNMLFTLSWELRGMFQALPGSSFSISGLFHSFFYGVLLNPKCSTYRWCNIKFHPWPLLQELH